MDLDDIDAPTQAPSRTSRFAPKSSKPKPKPKPKPEPLEPVPKAEPQGLDAAAIPKRKEDEEVPKVEPSASNDAVKTDVEEDDPMDVDDDGNDVVVREIDVFLTPSMDSSTQLYVFQYPLRPCWRPYELDERCEEVRVKPVNGEVEVDLALEADSKNYDQEIGSQLRMTKQTLSSSWKVPRTTSYAVGVLMGNKLHLNPIHAVVQLRPSLEHLSSGGSKRKNNVAGDAEVAVKLEECTEAKSVGPSKKQNKRMESSTENKTDDEEFWVPLKYHDSKSDISARYLERMVAQEHSPIQFTMNRYDYIDSLCPGACNNNSKPKGPSKGFLLSLPLEERVKKLLYEGPSVQRFSVFEHYAPDYSVEELLQVLKDNALLVQGLWTPTSNLLKLEKDCLPRDYFLLLFSKKSIILESEIIFKKKEEILETFAVKRPSLKDWKFKEHTDTSFIKQYPQIVEEQKQVWDLIEKNINTHFQGRRKSGPQEKNAISKPIVSSKPGKSVTSDKDVTKSATGVSTGRRTMLDETREALLKVLPKVFRNHKVCSFQVICQGLRELAISQSTLPKADARMAKTAANGVDDPPEELQEIISQVAINIHGLYVLKSSPEHPEYDQLRKVVIDLLCVKGPNAKLKKADVFEAAKIAFEKDITNNEYNKVMNDICVSRGSTWVLKSDGNSI